jgi:glycosyltransferase involved in cell wall biosynthesis
MYLGRLGVINALPPASKFGGAEVSMGLQINALKSMGFDIKLAVASTELARANEKTSVYHIFPSRNIYELFSRRKSFSLRLVWHLINYLPLNFNDVRKWLKSEKIDAVIVHNEYGLGFSVPLAAKALGIPVIKVVHDYSIACEKATFYRRNMNCKKFCIPCKPRRFASNFVGYSAYITVSDWMRQWLLNSVRFKGTNRITPSSIFVLYPRFKEQIPSRRAMKRKYPLAYLGRISKEKGVDFVLDECKKWNLSIVVAGTGETHEIDSLKKRFNKAVFLGSVEPNSFLKEVEVLVVPSKWNEPFGRVVAEAALNGCKVMISRQPGLIEAASASESIHTVFDYGDSKSFLKAWSELQGLKVDSKLNIPNILSNQDEILKKLLRNFFPNIS